MTNNDILRRLRYTYDYSDRQMISIFVLGEAQVTREQLSAWLKRDDDPAFQNIHDRNLARFLNGFIVQHRGKRDGPALVAEKQMNNNIILRKLKIALNLRSEAIIELLTSAGLPISKSELSAFFRKVGHKHYRECHDQILRNFLKGLQLQHRDENPWDQCS